MEFALSDPIFKKIFACGAIELGGCRPPDPPLAPLRLGGGIVPGDSASEEPEIGWGGGLGGILPDSLQCFEFAHE